jgi:hypothetical protein
MLRSGPRNSSRIAASAPITAIRRCRVEGTQSPPLIEPDGRIYRLCRDRHIAGLCRVPDYAGFAARSALTGRGLARHSLEQMLQVFEEVEQAVARLETARLSVDRFGFR